MHFLVIIIEKNHVKNLIILIITLSLCATAAWAGDVEDADAALIRKDYVTALSKYKSAAAKNDAYAQLQVGATFEVFPFKV